MADFIVVEYRGVFTDPRRPLEGIPTPRLLSEGHRPTEAWPVTSGSTTIWRARDDAYDAIHKPADVPYTLVIAGRAPEEA